MHRHYTHDYNVTLSELKKLIVDSGYSIVRFSKDSGVNLQRLYRVFAGEHILNAITGDYNPVIWKCCDFLHIHPDEVVPVDIAAARQRRLICEHVWLNRDTIKRKSHRIRILRKFLRKVSREALRKHTFHGDDPPYWLRREARKEWVATRCPYSEIFARYYGLNGDRSETLEEIGKDLGVTRELIRQVIQKSLRLIRGYLVNYRVGKEYHVILWDFMSYNNREPGVPKCTSPERLLELYHGCVYD